MDVRRKVAAVVVALALAGACGSGSGTEDDDGVPSGPDNAGNSGSTTTPTPYGDPNE